MEPLQIVGWICAAAILGGWVYVITKNRKRK